jgi:hypothetical protein
MSPSFKRPGLNRNASPASAKRDSPLSEAELEHVSGGGGSPGGGFGSSGGSGGGGGSGSN